MRLFSKKVDEEKMEEEILSMVEEGHEQGVIEEEEAEMISNIFDFADMFAKEIMTSRQKLIAIESGTTVDEAIHFALENNYSRYPVFEEDIDMIVGVVHLKDLIAAYIADSTTAVDSIMEDPIFIHPTFNISKLLKKMQKEQIHMAIVLDEYGQTEGLVTMEDIIEEIVGNILDEHDEIESNVRRFQNGVVISKGEAPLEELENMLDITFPEEDFQTLNGFLLYKLGRLPSDNEKLEVIFGGYKFVLSKIVDQMIKIVRIEKYDDTLENTDDKQEKEE